MTTINDIADFARILREQPEWTDTIRAILLGKDLLDLPQQLAEFVQLTNQRLQQLETRHDTLDDRLTRFIETTDRNFQIVHDRLERIESDVVDIKGNIVNVNGHMNQIYGYIDQINGHINQINGRIDQIDGKLDNRFGMTYEYKVQKNIGGIAGQYLNVRRTRVLLGGLITMDTELEELIEQAEDDHIITGQQNTELRLVDLIFTCRRRTGGVDMHVVAEISVTINDNYITRAAERAAILASVIGRPVTPAVVGTHIDDTRTTLAAATNVTVMLMPDD